MSVLVDVGGKVVGSAFSRIEGHVQDVEACGACVAVLCFLRIELSFVDFADVVAGELVEVALDVAWCECAAAAREDGVDVVPGQQGAVVAVCLVACQLAFREHAWCARHAPVGWLRQAALDAAALEVVEVRCVSLHAVVLPCDELCELAVEGDEAGLCALDERQLVYQVREPLAFLLPAYVEAPECVLQRFVAHADLCGEWLLAQVHQCAAYGEVLVYLVVEVQAEHCLALHAVGVVAFHRGADVRACVQEALVDDGDAPHVVVDGVVDVLGEGGASGGDDDGAACHVGHAQVYLSGTCALVASGQQELVVLGDLFGDGLRAVVELAEAILPSQRGVAYPLCQVFAEGFGHGEDDASLADGQSLHEVELSVGVFVVLGVEPVQVERPEQDGVLQLLFGQIGEVDASRVALVFDVESELVGHHLLCAQVVDVLHHQSPCGKLWAACGAFQEFDEECLRVVGEVGGEFAHLVGGAHVGVFEGDGQDVVHLQRAGEADVAQCVVDGVLRAGELTSGLQLLVVDASDELSRAVEDGCGLCDVACSGEVVDELVVFAVRAVAWHANACACPAARVADVGGFAQVGQCDDVAVVLALSALVRHPYFHALDVDAA